MKVGNWVSKKLSNKPRCPHCDKPLHGVLKMEPKIFMSVACVIDFMKSIDKAILEFKK